MRRKMRTRRSEGRERRLPEPSPPSPTAPLSGWHLEGRQHHRSQTFRITAAGAPPISVKGKQKCLPAASLSPSREEASAVISKGGFCPRKGQLCRRQTPSRLLPHRSGRYHPPRPGLGTRLPLGVSVLTLSQPGRMGIGASAAAALAVLCDRVESIPSFCTPTP